MKHILFISSILCLIQSDIIAKTTKLRSDVIRSANVNARPLKSGDRVVVHYTGWLNNDGQKGLKFDSSRDRNLPFEFILGCGRVIEGWDVAVAQMKVGEKRTVYIPSSMAYGERGSGKLIPPHSDLIFDIEVLSVK